MRNIYSFFILVMKNDSLLEVNQNVIMAKYYCSASRKCMLPKVVIQVVNKTICGYHLDNCNPVICLVFEMCDAARKFLLFGFLFL